MAGRPARAVAVVRHREAVLVCRDPEASGMLVLPSVSVTGDEPEAALRSLVGEIGVESAVVERRGESLDGRIPFLVSVADRTVRDCLGCPEPVWKLPAELYREADDGSWHAYAVVAPSVESVASDRERGSTAIATDALWALRDAATRAGANDDELSRVEPVAVDLLEARPSMAALGNRVNRAMAGAETPADVEEATTDGIVRSFEADGDAAALAAEAIADSRVLTLSRSGTVRAALIETEPEVVVLASQPGGEGLVVAEELVDAGLSVSTVPDADVYDRLRSRAVDVVLVGADAVTPDGGVVNKVGTRAAALAVERAGVAFYAVCASDKIRPSPVDEELGSSPPEPMFDLTPPRLVTALFTERGRLTPADVPAIADEHRTLATWRD